MEIKSALGADYERWLNGVFNKKPVVLEIGVGFNTPGVIRRPFERLVNLHNDVSFFRINSDYRNFTGTARPVIPEDIRSKSVSINVDAGEIIEALHDRLEGDGATPTDCSKVKADTAKEVKNGFSGMRKAT